MAQRHTQASSVGNVVTWTTTWKETSSLLAVSVRWPEIVMCMQLETYFSASVKTTTLPISNRCSWTSTCIRIRYCISSTLGCFVIPLHIHKRSQRDWICTNLSWHPVSEQIRHFQCNYCRFLINGRENGWTIWMCIKYVTFSNNIAVLLSCIQPTVISG